MDGQARLIVRHLIIGLILFLLWTWPGGLIWNRIEPRILGLPFSAFWVGILMPIAMLINAITYYRASLQLEEKEAQQG